MDGLHLQTHKSHANIQHNNTPSLVILLLQQFYKHQLLRNHKNQLSIMIYLIIYLPTQKNCIWSVAIKKKIAANKGKNRGWMDEWMNRWLEGCMDAASVYSSLWYMQHMLVMQAPCCLHPFRSEWMTNGCLCRPYSPKRCLFCGAGII